MFHGRQNDIDGFLKYHIISYFEQNTLLRTGVIKVKKSKQYNHESY